MMRTPHLILGLCLLLLAAGCRDRCKRIDCGPNGTCIEGDCACNSGYDGGLCEETVTEKFNKVYDLDETCTAGDDYYTVEMVPSESNPSQLFIIGLWEQEDTLVALVDDNGTDFSIARQAINNVEIAATGTGDDFGVSVEIDYQVYFSGQNDPFDRCSATLRNQ